MYANLSLVHKALKDAVAKKLEVQPKRVAQGEYMIREHKVRQRSALKAVSLPHRYKSKQKPQDATVEEELQHLSDKHPSIGFWQRFFQLRRQGHR